MQSQKGSMNGRSKLTVTVVRAIRKSKDSCRELARFWGMSKSEIHYIKTGKRWSHEL